MEGIDPQAFAALAREVRRLGDIEAIKRLRHAYFRCMDTAAFDEFRELFTPDFACRYIGSSYEYTAPDREAFVEAMQNSFNTEMAATHNGHHPEIDILDEDSATGRWYLQDVVYKWRTNELIYGTAIYTDRYRRTPDGWRICYSDYFRIVELVEYPDRPPRYTGHFLGEHGRKLPPLTPEERDALPRGWPAGTPGA